MRRAVEKGFTLIELLIVIAIIGLLAAVVLIAINPQEMMRRGRDSQRMSDMTNLRKAIDITVATNYEFDCAAGTCDLLLNSSSAARGSDGTGWFDQNLSANLPVLPVDPMNQAVLGVWANPGTGWDRVDRPAYYYVMVDSTSDTYELACYLESDNNQDKVSGDGGSDNTMFETGTFIGLTLITDGV